MKKRKYIPIFGAVIITLLMVSSATAVQYVNENETLESIEVPNMQNRLSEVRNSEEFLQLEQIANQYFPQEHLEYVENYIASMGLPEEVTTGTSYIILLILVEITLMLLGHNIVGYLAALCITLIGAIGPALLYGTIEGIRFEALLFDEFLNWLSSFSWAFYLQSFGLIGSTILFISGLTFGALLLVCCIPINWALGVTLGYLDAVLAMLLHMAGIDLSTDETLPQAVTTTTIPTITLEDVTTFISTASATSQSTT
jgi:hypothetical protein